MSSITTVALSATMTPLGRILRALAPQTSRAAAKQTGMSKSRWSRLITKQDATPGTVRKVISQLVEPEMRRAAYLAWSVESSAGLLTRSDLQALAPELCTCPDHALYLTALPPCLDCGLAQTCTPSGHRCESGCADLEPVGF